MLDEPEELDMAIEPVKQSSWTTIIYASQGSVQFSSVAQSSPTLCDPMNHSTPGLPVHHQLLEFTDSCPSSQ